MGANIASSGSTACQLTPALLRASSLKVIDTAKSDQQDKAN